MIHDVMVLMTGAKGDDNALAGSIAMAENLGAHLTVVESVNLPIPVANPWGLTPEIMMVSVYEDMRHKSEANAARLRSRLHGEAISWEVRVIESLLVDPPRNVALHGRYADICVLCAPSSQADGDAALVGSFFNALLFESGRPVLVVPPSRPFVTPISHAVVAWQPTREGTRALHDALPLLRRATTVDVLVVDPVVGDSRHGDQPGADIAVHLARHGIKVEVVVHCRESDTVAEALLRHANESGAQLLVAGGYGHSRLREWMLGGTTRGLLEAISLPILFSH